MQVGVSSYSFYQYMKISGADIFGVIDRAKELGFTSFEFTDVYPPAGVDAIEQAKAIRDYCGEVGMPISAYTVYADFLKYPDMVERLKRDMSIAAALGAPLLRHDVTGGFPSTAEGRRDFDAALPIVVPQIRRVTEYAESLGIRTMSENHGFFCQDSDRMERLVNAVGHENYGLLIDIGNFLCADEDPASAVERLAPYAFHVHLKDFFVRALERPDPGEGWFKSRGGNYLRGTVVGQGDVPVDECTHILKKQGYEGNYSIEFEGLEENIFALRAGLANLQSRFPD